MKKSALKPRFTGTHCLLVPLLQAPMLNDLPFFGKLNPDCCEKRHLKHWKRVSLTAISPSQRWVDFMTSSDPGPTNWGWVAVLSAAAAKVKKPSALPWSFMTGVKALSWKSSALRRPSWEWSDWLSFQYLFLYFSASSTCQDIFPSTRWGVNQGADQFFQPTTIQIHNYHLCDKNYFLYIWVHKLTLWRFKIQKKMIYSP